MLSKVYIESNKNVSDFLNFHCGVKRKKKKNYFPKYLFVFKGNQWDVPKKIRSYNSRCVSY